MPSDTPFAGINLSFSKNELVTDGVRLTWELMEEMLDRIVENGLLWPQPQTEFHNPKCPKLLTGGEKACRCSTAPWEGVFEDELARIRADLDAE